MAFRDLVRLAGMALVVWCGAATCADAAEVIAGSGPSAPPNAAPLSGTLSGAPAAGLTYFTPRASGIEVGIGYRSTTDDVQGVPDHPLAALATPDLGDSANRVYEVGANVSRSVLGVTLSAGLGYVGLGPAAAPATLAPVANEPGTYRTGTRIGVGNFLVGGGYSYTPSSPISSLAGTGRGDTSAWNLGAQYTMGSYVFGGGYLRSEDNHTLGTPGMRLLDIYSVGTTFTVTPGLNAGVEYDYVRSRTDTGVPDEHGSLVILKTKLAF